MRKIFTCLLFFALFASVAHAQQVYQPYSFMFYQKLSRDFYSPATSLHTSLKPYIISDSSSLKHSYDSIMNRTVDTSRKTWVARKLFNEHLFDVKQPDFTFYADYLPDLLIGKEFVDGNTLWLNTRGYQAGGTIGSKFFFYTSGFENQGHFPNYINNYVTATGMVPGQAYDFHSGQYATKDWMYVTSLLGYAPTNGIRIEAGIDKTFIGDGYRSMLLSDFASNYPLLRVKFDLGKRVQYMAMWAYLQDQDALKFGSTATHAPNRAKWAAFHYIDWNITNRASLGFFNALIAPDAYDDGSRHGFDINYINPILFAKSIAPSGPIPDNTFIGFNGKYKVLNKTIIYAQVLFDQSAGANGKNGYQLGLRGADLFKINSFNYLFEFNTAKPYTYSNQYPLVNYTDLTEPLAHPFGANFKEVLGILNYSIGRFDFEGQLNYAKYGLDVNNLNYGKNIFAPDIGEVGGNTGQGLSTTFKYAQGKISLLINPKYNLRLEAGAVLRQESNAQMDQKTALITFGLRSTFRDLYSDF
ncbi:MAG TPA: hypothetical protein VHE59_20405 [Mucilaginibacter sp.]|nr:hypothetical protein [Mucilaginibacter sp.]